MTVTFASVSRLIGLMSERDSPDTVQASVRSHLVTATNLITSYLGMPLLGTGEDVVLTFDTDRGFQPVGLTVPSFSRNALPSFDLPIKGPLPGLQVRYRGGFDIEEGFTWDDVDLLTPGEHYEHLPDSGRIRLLFHPSSLMNGLQVRYGTQSVSRPDIMIGEEARNALSRMRITANGSLTGNPANAFVGVPHKRAADCLVVDGGGGFSLQSVEGLGFASLTIYGPRDDAICDRDFAIRFIAGSTGESTGSLSPAVGMVLQHDYPDDVPVMSVGFETDEAIRLSKVVPRFLHPIWRHAEGIVPDTVTQACAQLARFLSDKSTGDGVGKASDKTRRNYASTGLIPADIRDMLSPYRRGSSAVTLI